MVSITYLCINGRGYDTGIPVINALDRVGFEAKLLRLDTNRLKRTLQALKESQNDLVITEDVLLPSLTLSLTQNLAMPKKGYIVRLIGDGLAEANEYSWQRSFLKRAIKRAITNSRSVIYASHYLKQRYASSFQMHNQAVIPNGINVDEVSPTSTDKNKFFRYTGRNADEGMNIVTVMNFDLEEKIFGLLQAQPAIERLCQEFDVQFYLIGSGKNVGLVHSRYLHKNVHLVGNVPHEDLCQILPLFSICFFPSSLDACPNAIIEAMAAGLPIVATNIGGIPEQVLDRYNGFLVPLNDIVSSSYTSIKILIEDSTIRRQYGIRARQKCVSEFSWGVIGNKFAEQVFQAIR